MPPERYVYFARDNSTGNIKIGRSVDPEDRVKNLSIGSLHIELISALYEDEEAEITERLLHKRFADVRVGGEWFSPTAELLELVDSGIKTRPLPRLLRPQRLAMGYVRFDQPAPPEPEPRPPPWPSHDKIHRAMRVLPDLVQAHGELGACVEYRAWWHEEKILKVWGCAAHGPDSRYGHLIGRFTFCPDCGTACGWLPDKTAIDMERQRSKRHAGLICFSPKLADGASVNKQAESDCMHRYDRLESETARAILYAVNKQLDIVPALIAAEQQACGRHFYEVPKEYAQPWNHNARRILPCTRATMCMNFDEDWIRDLNAKAIAEYLWRFWSSIFAEQVIAVYTIDPFTGERCDDHCD